MSLVEHGEAPRHRLEDFCQFVIGGRAWGAVQKLQIDDAAGGDAPGQQQRLDDLPHPGTGIASGQRTLVRQVDRLADSAPGAGHHLGIVELQSSRREQQLNEAPALLQLDHLIEGGIHGVGIEVHDEAERAQPSHVEEDPPAEAGVPVSSSSREVNGDDPSLGYGHRGFRGGPVAPPRR
jgi:hypothetical protein